MAERWLVMCEEGGGTLALPFLSSRYLLTMATRTANFIQFNGISIKTATYVVQYDERIDIQHIAHKKKRSWPTSICQERKKSPRP